MEKLCWVQLFAVFLGLNHRAVGGHSFGDAGLSARGGENCDPAPLIKYHEGQKECMYIDPTGARKIGFGYGLDRADAKKVIAKLGVNFTELYDGPATPFGSACHCSDVICISEQQIAQLFKVALAQATSDAHKAFSRFDELSCNVQNVLVDMSYLWGYADVKGYFGAFLAWLGIGNWHAAADDLSLTEWCIHYDSGNMKRCMDDVKYVKMGSTCFQPFTRKCNSSACCKEQETCCMDRWRFVEYIEKTLPEYLCCPYPNAECCPGRNACCPQGYPNCCPTYCCPPGYPVCKNKKCFSVDGLMMAEPHHDGIGEY
ncbi:Hypp1807 [Branchiostoma lanceolatum]|uniref:Hypp1807 protein n=1 Tax=Branchiostoma lanceolatum TaxID=7740 RepID=A0A8K0EQE8_BRALA|nr:Hypp1807 [Branchiostoma lanceolatum]